MRSAECGVRNDKVIRSLLSSSHAAHLDTSTGPRAVLGSQGIKPSLPALSLPIISKANA